MRWQARVIRFPAFLTLLVLLFLSCVGLLAQRTGAIIGQVRLPGGALLPQRVLVALQLRGATTNSTFTDNEGRFSFSQLMPAVYHVVVKAEGYDPVSQRAPVDPDVRTTTLVRIILRRREKTVPEPAPGPAFGGNPHMVSVYDYGRKFPRKVIKEFEAGVGAHQQGKTDEAIRHYEKAIELAPDFYPAHNNLGSLYLNQGEFEAAERAFSKAIELKQADANAYFNLGNVFFLTKRYENAARALREGLRRAPGSVLGTYLLGSVSLRLGNLVEAQHSLQRAVQLDPSMSQIRLELVNLYLVQQRKEDAIEALRAFVDHFPDDPMLPKVQEVLKKLQNRGQPPQ